VVVACEPTADRTVSAAARGRRHTPESRGGNKTLTFMTDSRCCDPSAAAFCRRLAARSTEESRSFRSLFCLRRI
jgi:hypothetical protein